MRFQRDVNTVRLNRDTDAPSHLRAVLHKRNGKKLLGCEVWTTRFVVVQDGEIIYYRSRGKYEWDAAPSQKRPLSSLVRVAADQKGHDHAFTLEFEHGESAPATTWYFACSCDEERDKWVQMLSNKLKGPEDSASER